MLSESFTDIKHIIYILSTYKKREQIYDNRLFGRHQKSEQQFEVADAFVVR